MRQFLYRQRKEISIPGSEESGAEGGSGRRFSSSNLTLHTFNVQTILKIIN
ncbi:hypothetical protein NC652_024427 [Populus alba x Populus x berolinensis]|nr:hypothetical protein NC652_024427 [Populus alba x Populus x berolinensis]